MQNPTTSDPSFKKFLEDLQKDNNRSFVTQLLQLKADREVAGEDDEKQKEQLEDINKSLGDIKSVLTGTDLHFNVEPLVQAGENNAELLQKSLEELALIRKLTEGSVEFDKKLAGYRNTSGREVQNKVSGKMAKVGGVIDFETARDFTSGQGKRAQEANAINLKTIDYVPGKSVSKAVRGQKADTEIDTEANDKLKEKTQFQGFGKEIVSGLKFFMTDGLSEKEGYGLFQKPPRDVVKKERETKVTGGVGADKPVTVNQESDNIVSAPEAVAEGTKADLEVSKQLLETTREQLTVLKEIKEALAPKTPAELTEQKSAPSATVEPNKGLELPSLPDIPKIKPKPGVPPAPSAALAAGVIGGVAVGGAAATYAATGLLAAQTEHRKAYSAEQDKTGMLSAMSGDTGLAANILDANQGQSPEAVRAAQQKEQEQLKNAPWYTRMLGVGKASYLKENAPKLAPAAPKETVAGKTATGASTQSTTKASFNEAEFAQKDPTNYKKFVDFRNTRTEQISKNSPFAKTDPETASSIAEVKATEEAIIKFKPEIEAVNAGKVSSTESKVTGGPGAKNPSVTAATVSPKETVAGKKVELQTTSVTPTKSVSDGKIPGGGQISDPNAPGYNANAAEYQRDRQGILAKTASATPVEKVDGTKNYLASAGTLSADPQMDKDIREHRKQVGEIKSKKPDQNYLDAAPAIKSDVKPDNYLAPAATTPVGAEVARTSTENADMSREAGKSGGNNTIVSNNVSSNNTTKFVPMKPSPRPQSQGSALDRYQDRVTVY